LKKAVGSDFDVVLEWHKVHIHCEYQPKASPI